MKGILSVLAVAFCVLALNVTEAKAIGRRGGMICNVAQAQGPAQAQAENLVQTLPKNIVQPLVAQHSAPVFNTAPVTKFNAKTLQALNTRPGTTAPAANVAAK